MSSRRAGPLRPFSVDHWRRWASNLVLDSGDLWVPEPFQLDVMEELFSGVPEVLVDIPEGNGKTTLISGAALYYGHFTPDAMIPMAAAAREQTEPLFSQAAGFVRRTPGLEKRFRVFEGYRRITCLESHGRIQVFAADERTGDGIIPGGLAILEELHRHKSLRLYRTWRGKLQKRGAQMVSISTAGDPDGEYEELKADFLAKAESRERLEGLTVARAPGFSFRQHSLEHGDDLTDFGLVKTANPLGTITPETLEAKFASPSTRPEHWARFVCGVPFAEESPWVIPAEWDACQGVVEPDRARDVLVGVDIGQVQDSSAVVEGWWVDGKLHVASRVWNPVPGHPVTIGEVEAHIMGIADRRDVREVAYDPWRFQRSAEVLEGRIQTAEFPQSNGRMAKASTALYDLIREGRLVHDGDPTLRAHVLAGVAEETEQGWRVSKKKNKRKIDALIALAMVADRAVHHEPSSEVVVEVFG